MFNSGGAVEQFDVRMVSNNSDPLLFDGEVSSELSNSLSDNRSPTATVALTVRGCGRFGAYSSQRPLKCTTDSVETEISYDSVTGLVTMIIPVPDKEMYRCSVEFQL